MLAVAAIMLHTGQNVRFIFASPVPTCMVHSGCSIYDKLKTIILNPLFPEKASISTTCCLLIIIISNNHQSFSLNVKSVSDNIVAFDSSIF